jgi:IclR family transcriptional regulator, KDG regulon repressor
MEKKKEYVNKSLKKALSLLKLFDRATEPLSITEIAAKVNATSGTIYPIIFTLESEGFLERDADSKKYRLGLSLLRLGMVVSSQLSIRDRAQVFLKRLFEQTNENVHLAIFEEKKVIYIDRKEARPDLRVHSFIGKRAPAHCTALGKTFLAFMSDHDLEEFFRSETLEKHTNNTITDPDLLRAALQKIRSNGYAIENEEYQLGGNCVASPVRNHRGETVAAVSVSIPNSRYTPERLQSILAATKEATGNISASLGYIEPEAGPQARGGV